MSLALGLLGGAIGLGGWLGGKAMDYGFNSALLDQSFEHQLALLEKQQEWSEYMTRHAHQFEVEDLRLAGLNPILSAGGSGANWSAVSAPGVPSTSMPGGNGNPGSAFIEGAKAGVTAEKLSTEVQNVEANTALAESKIATEQSQAELNDALKSEAEARAAEIRSGLPLNRIPGSGLQSGKSFLNEAWNAGKDFFDSSASAKRLEKMEQDARNYGIYRRSDGRLERREDFSFNVVPAGEVINGKFVPRRGFEHMTK